MPLISSELQSLLGSVCVVATTAVVIGAILWRIAVATCLSRLEVAWRRATRARITIAAGITTTIARIVLIVMVVVVAVSVVMIVFIAIHQAGRVATALNAVKANGGRWRSIVIRLAVSGEHHVIGEAADLFVAEEAADTKSESAV